MPLQNSINVLYITYCKPADRCVISKSSFEMFHRSTLTDGKIRWRSKPQFQYLFKLTPVTDFSNMQFNHKIFAWTADHILHTFSVYFLIPWLKQHPPTTINIIHHSSYPPFSLQFFLLVLFKANATSLVWWAIKKHLLSFVKSIAFSL